MSTYSNYTDQRLTALLKKKDQLAFTEIYNRYWKALLAIAWNHSRQTAHAKDIVHEVFMSLWERGDQVDIQDLAAFLATSVKFRVFRHYQKEQRRTELAKEHYLFEELNNEPDKIDALFMEEYINGVVEEMPEKCKLVFRYSRQQGLKNSEIAQKLQITEKGVEAALTRALKIIRAELKNYILLTLLFLLFSCSAVI
jgi:RNA polymerase sigma-70 factor (ECF subfamily)